MKYELHNADCLEFMRGLPDNHVDAIVTDPPYELGFMGKSWDRSGIANSVEMWSEALRILKPGGHLLAFSGSRTYHRMTCAIEDAGFEVRDQIMWVYGSGFPKSLDVSKAIDKAAGAKREVVGSYKRGMAMLPGNEGADNWRENYTGEVAISTPATPAARQWQGWGTALKPAHEPICVARKPLEGTVAENVMTWGTGAVNVDGCRVGTEDMSAQWGRSWNQDGSFGNGKRASQGKQVQLGRWPANLIHDGSEEVVGLFPSNAGGRNPKGHRNLSGERTKYDYDIGEFHPNDSKYLFNGLRVKIGVGYTDTGSAARFFYCAKASKADRGDANSHPTVKPTELMRYLCMLVTPPGGLVFDPFTGSGSTGKAAVLEGFRFLGCDMTPEYVDIARARIEHAINTKPNTLF
jgi:site-specific DNA-methyltransferase (adenine-specific)